MKKLISISFLLLAFNFIYANEKPKVVCTASMIWDIAQNIFGDKANVELIVPVGGDPHLYEPTPNDAQLVNSADLVLKNGLSFEGWLGKLIENSGTKADVVRVTEGVKTIKSLVYDNAEDPHAWMDLTNGIVYAKNIRDAAKKLIPKEASYFDQQYVKYEGKLKDADAYVIKRINEIPKDKRVLITSHDAFQYYGEKYGIVLESTMGTSTDADVQTSDMNAVYKKIKDTGVAAIFIESTVNPKLIKQIAKDLNVKIGGKLHADSIGEKGTPGDTYITMLTNNTDIIVDALKGTSNSNTGTTETKTDSTPKDSGFNMIYGLLGLIILLGILFMFIRKKNS